MFAAAWAGDQVSSPVTSCTLLLRDKEENSSSSSWPGYRLFPRGVQVLLVVLSPCRGCPAFAHAEGGGQSSQQGHPTAKHSNTAAHNSSPARSLGPKGLRGFLSSVWFVESAACSGSHSPRACPAPLCDRSSFWPTQHPHVKGSPGLHPLRKAQLLVLL